jgi:hypothetical protein
LAARDTPGFASWAWRELVGAGDNRMLRPIPIADLPPLVSMRALLGINTLASFSL